MQSAERNGRGRTPRSDGVGVDANKTNDADRVSDNADYGTDNADYGTDNADYGTENAIIALKMGFG